MPVTTFEGIVEGGVVRLPEGVTLPERVKVYVVVPNPGRQTPVRIMSPRLVNPDQAADFEKTVTRINDDAGL